MCDKRKAYKIIANFGNERIKDAQYEIETEPNYVK